MDFTDFFLFSIFLLLLLFFFVVSALLRAGYVVDAVSPVDLVSPGTMLHYSPLHGQLPREGDAHAHVRGQGGVLSRRLVPERPQPQPVGGCYEHLHARVWIRPGELKPAAEELCNVWTVGQKCSLERSEVRDIVRPYLKMRQSNLDFYF